MRSFVFKILYIFLMAFFLLAPSWGKIPPASITPPDRYIFDRASRIPLEFQKLLPRWNSSDYVVIYVRTAIINRDIRDLRPETINDENTLRQFLSAKATEEIKERTFKITKKVEIGVFFKTVSFTQENFSENYEEENDNEALTNIFSSIAQFPYAKNKTDDDSPDNVQMFSYGNNFSSMFKESVGLNRFFDGGENKTFFVSYSFASITSENYEEHRFILNNFLKSQTEQEFNNLLNNVGVLFR
ncbi:MAG: hypothetical protein A2504_04030 [Bdellovibrionales bacterium RIFOXYD12_FULL_39_22]|nr:MAG: hypothetical protein A2385_11780 [Bdellovibrionales bacterium RIFOXYB1_FULL_39_21]OFZ41744.1 MAG: hypothetical protein A2485_02090 [Bdellovibrionales bacterium RIFOXYC12_FULL_39_17]OFZ46144.1 MAG: hypothetical protein A2404_12455 [Bdellovibrionales bacterium RIFOXYC1_FULL_39_130]OFZ71668.1 MAG: hypothetical protein A2451_03485 [Bdellovibrionales bacterium RIFOXYC2_FULL_39_8]OFZ74970.1 MAG: hypothetical protein A2560_15495 [Bdellovibrionales bacterium RIFOXYD1_FULL_39_84]OFZ92823.1 MAG: